MPGLDLLQAENVIKRGQASGMSWQLVPHLPGRTVGMTQ